MKPVTNLTAEESTRLVANIDLLHKLGVTVKWKDSLCKLFYNGDLVGIYTRHNIATTLPRVLFRRITDCIACEAVRAAVHAPSHGW